MTFDAPLLRPAGDRHAEQGSMTGTEVAGAARLSGRATVLFCKLFTIRPVGDVYIMLLLSGQVAQAYFAVWPSP